MQARKKFLESIQAIVQQQDLSACEPDVLIQTAEMYMECSRSLNHDHQQFAKKNAADFCKKLSQARHKNKGANVALCFFMTHGIGSHSQTEKAEAMKTLKMDAIAGEPRSQWYLGKLTFGGMIAESKCKPKSEREEEGYQLILKSAEQRFPRAMQQASTINTVHGLPTNWDKEKRTQQSIRFTIIAAKADNASALFQLAELLCSKNKNTKLTRRIMREEHCELDWLTCFEKSVIQHNKFALYKFAQILFSPNEVHEPLLDRYQDRKALAFEYLTLAADLRHGVAKQKLKENFKDYVPEIVKPATDSDSSPMSKKVEFDHAESDAASSTSSSKSTPIPTPPSTPVISPPGSTIVSPPPSSALDENAIFSAYREAMETCLDLTARSTANEMQLMKLHEHYANLFSYNTHNQCVISQLRQEIAALRQENTKLREELQTTQTNYERRGETIERLKHDSATKSELMAKREADLKQALLQQGSAQQSSISSTSSTLYSTKNPQNNNRGKPSPSVGRNSQANNNSTDSTKRDMNVLR